MTEDIIKKPIEIVHSIGTPPENKCYLLLLTIYPNDTSNRLSDAERDWSIRIGRQETYDYLKTMIKSEIVDPNLSFIIAGKVDDSSSKNNFIPESNPITVFRFMKVMFDSQKVLDDGIDFCIDEYISTDSSEDVSILDA